MRVTATEYGGGMTAPGFRSRRPRPTAAGEDLTGEVFEKFLAWLDPSREQAGRVYEGIRAGLIRLFLRHDCAAAEELADETINRVIRSVHRLADSFVGERAAYFYVVAKRLRYERHRRPAAVALQEAHVPVSDPLDEVSEEYDRRLERAMNLLSASDRELIIRYYQGDGQGKIDHRRKLAAELGVGLNALRIRVHRIRTELRGHMGV